MPRNLASQSQQVNGETLSSPRFVMLRKRAHNHTHPVAHRELGRSHQRLIGRIFPKYPAVWSVFCNQELFGSGQMIGWQNGLNGQPRRKSCRYQRRLRAFNTLSRDAGLRHLRWGTLRHFRIMFKKGFSLHGTGPTQIGSPQGRCVSPLDPTRPTASRRGNQTQEQSFPGLPLVPNCEPPEQRPVEIPSDKHLARCASSHPTLRVSHVR